MFRCFPSNTGFSMGTIELEPRQPPARAPCRHLCLIMEREESCSTDLFCDEPALDNIEVLFLNKGLDHIFVDLVEGGFDNELAVFSDCLDEPKLEERKDEFKDFDDSELGLRKDFDVCLDDPKLKEREDGFKDFDDSELGLRKDFTDCLDEPKLEEREGGLVDFCCTRLSSFFCFRPHFVFPKSVDRPFGVLLGFLIAALLL